MRVAKSNFGSRRNQNNFKVSKRANSDKLPQLKVGFSNNFPDTFGLKMEQVTSKVNSLEGTVDISGNLVDILASKGQNFVEDISGFAINLSENDDGEVFIAFASFVRYSLVAAGSSRLVFWLKLFSNRPKPAK